MHDDQRVFGLDLMRASAILLVVFNHSFVFVGIHYREWRRWFDFAGFSGVELFFVLSGFLIGGIVLKTVQRDRSSRALTNFWSRRWFRTLPNYFLFLLVHYLVWVYLKIPREAIEPYLLFLQNFDAGGQRFFPVSWSLAIEEWFYLLFPLVLWLSFRFWPTENIAERCLQVIFAVLVAFVALRYVLVTIYDPPWGTGVRLRLITRLDAPIYGVLAAYMAFYHAEQWQRFRWHALAAGIGLFGLVAWHYHSGPAVGDSYWMKTGFFSLTSIAFALWLPVLSAWRSASGSLAEAVTWISLWSYSLYLCHDPLRRLVVVVYARGGQYDSTTAHLYAIGFFVLALAVSAVVYRRFEKPMMDLRERFSFSKR